jgi:hypothetical protein
MEKHATVRYEHPTNAAATRYIHKYYLPRELKARICPADIGGIESCFWDEKECNVRENRIPEELPACIIHYEDIGLEKRIEGDTVCRVLEAYAAYRKDSQAELTPEETRAALNLNAWLTDWETQLLAQCIQLSEDMERRVRSSDPWLTDYEIDLEVTFYVRDDDPFSEDNDADASEDDVDSDATLLCETKHLGGPIVISADMAAREDYWGIGDRQNHNDRKSLTLENPIYKVRHCLSFHELYDHLHVPMKHLRRIGRVFADIKITYQNGINVDLTGEKATAMRDQPRVRKSFLLRDET